MAESLPERLAREAVMPAEGRRECAIGCGCEDDPEVRVAAAIRAALDEAAKVADAKAYAEECADDTMAGRTRAVPFKNIAAAIRDLKG